jgi:hypothetical protein
MFCIVKRILELKEPYDSTKHHNKNKNYNKILEILFVLNLQMVSTAHRCCQSYLSRPDVVGCGWEIIERV